MAWQMAPALKKPNTHIYPHAGHSFSLQIQFTLLILYRLDRQSLLVGCGHYRIAFKVSRDTRLNVM